MNFLFRGSDGRTYAGTGGHCIFDGAHIEGKQTWKPGKGIPASDAERRRIGETAFWALRAGEFDFGLIRLDRRIKANPQMCQYGGPTGIYSGAKTDPAAVHFFSTQSDLGPVLPGRTLFAAFGFPNRYTVDTFGVAAPGDSGAPAVLDDGRAVGLLTSIGVGYSGQPGQQDFSSGNVFLVKIAPQLRVAERALKIDLDLLKAPQV